ncbi:hypothetical protein F4777DRAFT_346368 [Nemania sp. FL0916]|nr:hypothetical protein F4777DRAFT_346368 [Nemania sp. FL0916]
MGRILGLSLIGKLSWAGPLTCGQGREVRWAITHVAVRELQDTVRCLTLSATARKHCLLFAGITRTTRSLESAFRAINWCFRRCYSEHGLFAPEVETRKRTAAIISTI